MWVLCACKCFLKLVNYIPSGSVTWTVSSIFFIIKIWRRGENIYLLPFSSPSRSLSKLNQCLNYLRCTYSTSITWTITILFLTLYVGVMVYTAPFYCTCTHIFVPWRLQMNQKRGPNTFSLTLIVMIRWVASNGLNIMLILHPFLPSPSYLSSFAAFLNSFGVGFGLLAYSMRHEVFIDFGFY